MTSEDIAVELGHGWKPWTKNDVGAGHKHADLICFAHGGLFACRVFGRENCTGVGPTPTHALRDYVAKANREAADAEVTAAEARARAALAVNVLLTRAEL